MNKKIFLLFILVFIKSYSRQVDYAERKNFDVSKLISGITTVAFSTYLFKNAFAHFKHPENLKNFANLCGCTKTIGAFIVLAKGSKDIANSNIKEVMVKKSTNSSSSEIIYR